MTDASPESKMVAGFGTLGFSPKIDVTVCGVELLLIQV